ncbi:MAG: flippase-like domain-containing protein [Chloroflexi bacterium]|nr:flippase-like domain-containing protein [Chloroflexota bacterium]
MKPEAPACGRGGSLKILAGISLLLISFFGINWEQLRSSLDQVTFIGLLAVIGTVLLGLYLKIIRWYLFLSYFGIPVTFTRIVEAFFLGQATNILLPWRAGEVFRVGYLAGDQPAYIPQVTASVVLEKILDTIALVSIALMVAVYLPDEKATWVRNLLLPLSILAIAVLIVMIGWGPGIWERLRKRLAERSHPWIEKSIPVIDQFVENSRWLRNPSRLVMSLSVTVVIWIVMWLTNILLFYVLHFQLPVVAGGLVLVMVYIGVLPALMPGNVGPFYFFAQLGVTPFGVEIEAALAFAILLHAVVTLTPLIVSGTLFLLSDSTRKMAVAKLRFR